LYIRDQFSLMFSKHYIIVYQYRRKYIFFLQMYTSIYVLLSKQHRHKHFLPLQTYFSFSLQQQKHKKFFVIFILFYHTFSSQVQPHCFSLCPTHSQDHKLLHRQHFFFDASLQALVPKHKRKHIFLNQNIYSHHFFETRLPF